jgi:hypothetical protein
VPAGHSQTRPVFRLFAPFNPSYDLTVPVTFTPARTGTFTGRCQLTWTDRLGTHHLTVVLTGRGA